MRFVELALRGVMCALAMMVCLVVAVDINSCSAELRHRVIIYDEPWSSAAGVKNLQCIPEIAESCKQEALAGEAEFSKSLSAAFRRAPDCSRVDFIVLPDGGDKQLEEQLAHGGDVYWRLRVDFHKGFPQQSADLTSARYGGHGLRGFDAEREAGRLCTEAKEGGIIHW